MSLRSSAKFLFGGSSAARIRFMPLGGDKLMPAVKTAIGGTGPFDFTSAHSVISAVPIVVKVDSSAEIADTIDLSGAGSESAVTALEVANAITASSIAGMTASVDANGRVKIVSGSGTWLQVYGLAAELADFGQGIGQKFILSNTVKSLQIDPEVKEDTTVVTTPADGIDVSVIVEGYKKGFKGTIVDTAEDFYIMRLMENGTIDATTGAYEDPTENTEKVYFFAEVYAPVYGEGANKESELQSWQKILLKSCVGSVGGFSPVGSAFRDRSYSITGTNYKPSAGVVEGATELTPLTIAAYAALAIDSV